MTETDPAAAVRAMMDQWLALSTAVAERTVGHAELSAAAQAGIAASVTQALAKSLGDLDLPARADLHALAAAVVALDARLERIETALAKR